MLAAMIPLWLYTLGTHFIDDETNIRIPFENILASLAGILVPVAIGKYMIILVLPQEYI